MTSYIFHGNESYEEMKVNNSIDEPISPEMNEHSIQQDPTKSIFLKRKNLSLKNSKIIFNSEEGMIYGSKLSGKKMEQQPEDNVRITRSFKIDCSGPSRIIGNPEVLTQQYVIQNNQLPKEEKPVIKEFNPQTPASNTTRQEREETREGREDLEQLQLNMDIGIDNQFTILFAFLLLFLILSLTNSTVNYLTNHYIIKPYEYVSMRMFK